MMIFMYSDPGIAQSSYGEQKIPRDPGGLSTSEVKLLSYTPKKYTSKDASTSPRKPILIYHTLPDPED